MSNENVERIRLLIKQKTPHTPGELEYYITLQHEARHPTQGRKKRKYGLCAKTLSALAQLSKVLDDKSHGIDRMVHHVAQQWDESHGPEVAVHDA